MFFTGFFQGFFLFIFFTLRLQKLLTQTQISPPHLPAIFKLFRLCILLFNAHLFVYAILPICTYCTCHVSRSCGHGATKTRECSFEKVQVFQMKSESALLFARFDSCLSKLYFTRFFFYIF